MRPITTRRHALLFLSALILPCVVLIGLGIYMIQLTAEIDRGRAANDRKVLTEQVERELLTRVEQIKLEQAGSFAAKGILDLGRAPRRAEVAVLGWIRDGRLALPWDVDPAAAAFLKMLYSDSPSRVAMREGERLENVTVQYADARAAYQKAKLMSTTPLERDFAMLRLGAAFVKCECADDAAQLYEPLLQSDVIDENGVPLAFYAATMLLGMNRDARLVLDLLEKRGSEVVWMSDMAATYEDTLIASLKGVSFNDADKARVQQIGGRHHETVANLSRAQALQRTFATLFPVSAGDPTPKTPLWIPFGDAGEWLVSVAPALAGLPPLAIAIRTEAMVDALRSGSPLAGIATPSLRASTSSADGELVGGAFPGLRVSLPAGAGVAVNAWPPQRLFYVVALVAVIAVTVVGGYLFWRDVRRELRVAEMRSQFVASVSHELRTPLTAIRMFAETLQMERPLDRSARGEYLDTIVNESERLTRLINNVLDFSKIERGEKVYRLEPASLAAIVRHAADAMQYPLARQGFELHVEVNEDVSPVRVDPDAMQQAVLNLLSNAMKYSRDRREIALSLVRANGDAVIAVKDFGLGIPASEQRRIFERFYRAPVQENRRIPGAGLGLALVDHIVKGHGGHVEVASVVGQGSTFAIHLPLGGQA